MNKASFCGKCAPEKEQIDNCISAMREAGYVIPNVEVQLIENLTDLDKTKLFMRDDINVVSVHTPLYRFGNKCETIYLEYITNYEVYESLRNTVEFANKLANYFGHDIFVILHNGISAEYVNMVGVPNIGIIANNMEKLIREFPNVRYSIENTTPIYSGGSLPEDAPSVCFELKKYLGKQGIDADKYIYITIDVCHILCTNFQLRTAFVGSSKERQFSISEYIDKAKKYNCEIFNIHLANIKGNGSGKNHGTAFSSAHDDELLFSILDVLKNIGNDELKIVIEVREDFFTGPRAYSNLITTLNSINKYKSIVSVYEAYRIIA